MPRLKHPSLTPTADEEALQQPLVDPIQTIASMGGLSSLLEAIPFAAKDMGGQFLFAKALQHLMPESDPQTHVENWYGQRQEPMKYKVPDTAPLMREKGFGDTAGLSKQEQKYYPGEGYPEYHSKLPPLIPVGENPPRPEDLIYHGLATDLQGSPETATEHALSKIPQIQEGGLRSGWFSEQPHDPFGPLYVGASPNDVWKQYPRRNKMQIDPSVELTPYGGSIAEPKKPINPETIMSKTGIVPPEKLWLIDHQGNLLGRLAPGQNEPGYENWKGSATEHWKNQAKPLQEGEEGVVSGPKSQSSLPFDEQGKMIPWSEDAITKDLKSETQSINSIATKYGVEKEVVQDIWKNMAKSKPKPTSWLVELAKKVSGAVE